ncbi:Hsp70 family protein [Lacihabitans soyangensis]|uniref:Hsp70 family protein n=1 Tax=Lacihabitans soyangensis TaxID=869394 RepID=A0AAE3H3D6_9BACT|nr:Hsp70 family protein [Lacihabitans soyangensis]MCP9764192.1 Hsp70 family protein [Lacihabitans soyangensis]
MQKYIYGIDFGTSNSALAILDTDTREAVKLFTVPSLLFFQEPKERGQFTKVAVGQDAIDQYVQNRMTGRFMKSIKKVLPNKSFVDTRIGNRMYKAEDLVALILVHLKKLADDFLSEDIKTAVIGRPVVFDEAADKDTLAQIRLEKAAKIAGFEKIHFQLEPVGAAYTYERQIEKSELVLVADFGGGTSDFSLMRLDPAAKNLANRKSDIIGQGGIYIGGDNFDSDIMWHKGTPHFGRGVKEEFTPGKPLDLPLSYFQNICSWEKMNFLDTLRMKLSIEKSYQYSGKDFRVKNLQILISENLGYSFFKEIEKAKITLTHEEKAALVFQKHGIEIEEEVSLSEFKDEIIAQNLSKIEDYLDQFLVEKGIGKDEIDVVFMTGGTSLIKPLNQIFKDKFGEAKLKSGDNFNSVAMGLAYSYLNMN